MRNLVAGFAISLEGYIEGPKGEYDWIIMDKEFDFVSHMKRFDAFFFGRKSFLKLKESGNVSFPGIKNYVFSNSLQSSNEDFVLLKGDIPKLVTQIKKQDGKDIAVYGGANLLSSLLNMNLVDELIMSIVPVVLGDGKSMVDSLKQRVNLQLIDTRTFSSGTIQLAYKVGSNKTAANNMRGLGVVL